MGVTLPMQQGRSCVPSSAAARHVCLQHFCYPFAPSFASRRARSHGSAPNLFAVQAVPIAEAVPEAIAAETHAGRLGQDNGQLQMAQHDPAVATDLASTDPEDLELTPGELTLVDRDSPEAPADVFRCKSRCEQPECKVSVVKGHISTPIA